VPETVEADCSVVGLQSFAEVPCAHVRHIPSSQSRLNQIYLISSECDSDHSN